MCGFGVVMGTGNYYLVGAESVYIDMEDVYGKEYWEADLSHYFDDDFDNFISIIIDNLPSSFQQTERCWLDRGRQLIAVSGMYLVSIVEWEGYISLNIEVIENIRCSPLAKYHLHTTANRIFDKLNQIYNLRVRDTSWTSCQRISEFTKLAA
jgi:hypothetical protein